MKELSEFEILSLKAYLELPIRKILKHQFELEEDIIAAHVIAFLKGKRYDKEIIAFSKHELEIINPIISSNIYTKDGKDLLSAFLLTKLVCNIMNKYRVY